MFVEFEAAIIAFVTNDLFEQYLTPTFVASDRWDVTDKLALQTFSPIIKGGISMIIVVPRNRRQRCSALH